MPVIESKIMINSKSFKKNQQDHAKLIDEVRTLEKKIADNSARSKEKFEKRGQLWEVLFQEEVVGSFDTEEEAQSKVGQLLSEY